MHMRISRNWLQTFFSEELPSAQELADVFTFYAFEVEEVVQVGEDWVLDLDVLPNRSSDCLSHRGIAYELATLLSLPLVNDPLREVLLPLPEAHTFRISLEKEQSCDMYMGAVVRGVTIAPSPEWLQTYLRTIGQRPINNIVDITNYVMFQLGQPMHAFDTNKLAVGQDEKRHIGARSASEGESITVLTGETYTLTPEDTVIADIESGDALAVAGIKGGKHAEITEETTDILLEAAHFAYTPVRKTSRRLKLATESSLRFQNDPSALLPEYAMREALRLVEEIAGGKVVGVATAGERPPAKQPVDVQLTRINTLLGTTLSIEDVENILIRFGWEFSRDGEEFAIASPWERTDLTIPEEFIEEIGRVYGYKTMQGILPPKPKKAPTVHKMQYYTEKICDTLSGLGYNEVYTYTLQDKGEMTLANPLAADKSHMRIDLARGMREALEKNAYTAPTIGEYTAVRCFEIGTVWNGGREYTSLAVGVRAIVGKQGKAEQQLLADIETLAGVLGTSFGAHTVQNGVVEIDISALLSELPEPAAYDLPLPFDVEKRYTPWSAFPHMLRDIAVWVPEHTPAEEVAAVIIEIAPETLLRHDLFDSFTKDGRTSYAWHLVFQSATNTLTDEAVGAVMQEIANACTARGWEVR